MPSKKGKKKGGGKKKKNAAAKKEKGDAAPPKPQPPGASTAGQTDDIDRTVPIISVRQPWTSECGTTCGGKDQDRPPKVKICGPTPPDSQNVSTAACGMRSCFDEDVCTCRCPCSLRLEMRRRELESSQSPVDTPLEVYDNKDDLPQVHLARIFTLEPRQRVYDFDKWPSYQIQRHFRRYIACPPPSCRPPRTPQSDRNPFYDSEGARWMRGERRHYCGGQTVSQIRCLF